MYMYSFGKHLRMLLILLMPYCILAVQVAKRLLSIFVCTMNQISMLCFYYKLNLWEIYESWVISSVPGEKQRGLEHHEV